MLLPPEIEEVFQINLEFARRLAFFTYTYLNQEPVYDLPRLLRDLADHLGARAAICTRIDAVGRLVILEREPKSADPIIRTMMKNKDVLKIIQRFLSAECITPETITYNFSQDVNTPEKGQVDIFAVPPQVGAELGYDRPHCFLLVDPAELACYANDLDNRIIQSGHIRQFLIAWWVLATAPRYSDKRSQLLRPI